MYERNLEVRPCSGGAIKYTFDDHSIIAVNKPLWTYFKLLVHSVGWSEHVFPDSLGTVVFTPNISDPLGSIHILSAAIPSKTVSMSPWLNAV